MYHINFNNSNQKIHFVGIGGISMSGLAQIMNTEGFTISGSDISSTKTTKDLQNSNINVICGHSSANITKGINLVVHTAAIPLDNPELTKARELNIPILNRAEFLGQLMRIYDYPICIAGTHGKTTTTSMMADVLLKAHLDPTITLGGMLDSIEGNIHIGKSEYFLTEACEYYDSFLNFYPRIGIILNIDEDHMDYFKDLDHIRTSFYKFANTIPEDGLLIINGSIDNLDGFTKGLKCNIETFGLSTKDTWYATNISYDKLSCPSFDIMYKGKHAGHISLNVPGEHNIYNALSICAGVDYINVPFNYVIKGFESYKGTNQRFEVRGDLKGITIVDDYAHHPTEVKVTLEVAQHRTENKVWCVFQPHTYTRTKTFLKEFAEALCLADEIIISDIYAAREKDPGDIHSTDLVKEIHSLGRTSSYMSSFDEITNHLLTNCKPGDMVITMGAGTINSVGDELLGL